MRFIGSKKHLLNEIDAILLPHLSGNEKSFVDLFAGSNVVAKHFKPMFAITTNDFMAFSRAISEGSVVLNSVPDFAGLHQRGIEDPLKYLQTRDISKYLGETVTREYSPAGPDNRMYFTTENARRIDFIRNKIDFWKKENFITENEFYYLLNALLQAVPFVSNITGTYGAYLKHWDKRAMKSLELNPSAIIDNKEQNNAFSEDSLKLIKKISGDIVYIDPPYNNRQYAPNYHVLETIAKNDNPELHGITGQRNYDDEKSAFSIKRKAVKAMSSMLSNLNFTHAVVSYSTDGIIAEEELLALLKTAAVNEQVIEKRIPYRKYKSKVVKDGGVLYELLFYFQPKTGQHKQRRVITRQKRNQFKEEKSWGFIKSPLNYVGGKYKLLPQIFPLFPKSADIFVDLFSGGGNVGINANAKKIYFNDINSKINGLFRFFQGRDPVNLLKMIHQRIDYFHLSKTNKQGFLDLRNHYNKNPNPIDLYVLVSFSFNYQFRFNNHLQYNNPFGYNRSHFSERMADNLVRFVTRLNNVDAQFTDYYFSDFDFSELTSNSFVYADPPYLITTGSYNDGNRGFVDWTEKQELQLYDVLDALTAKGVKFALSNVMDHKGHSNDLLKRWSQKYHVTDLNYGYQNSSYNTFALESREVLITNY
ncbi:Dam family site-specific DNA-(adenine-N6)-methyltransferase [Lacticaseibacillus paracasei]|uniref:Dam family site-specific DNA-(adenine-N6)-methyltransferase n=1 Tax=Lacticaseibacillus paracasei TaxID=1597 RepID=UPI0033990A84